MSYYNSNSYFYPRVRQGNLKVNHIVDFTPEELRQCEEERKMIEPYLRFNTRTEQIIIMPFDA